jgi:hypothetical protein
MPRRKQSFLSREKNPSAPILVERPVDNSEPETTS